MTATVSRETPARRARSALLRPWARRATSSGETSETAAGKADSRQIGRSSRTTRQSTCQGCPGARGAVHVAATKPGSLLLSRAAHESAVLGCSCAPELLLAVYTEIRAVGVVSAARC